MTVCEECGHSANWDVDSVPWNSMLFSPTDFSSSATNLRIGYADIESEMERFKAFSALYISALTNQQKDLKARLDAVVYPVLSLPTEITCRIFVECLREDGYVRPSAKRAPLLFMRVCRAWRNIAVSTPELWCSLELEYHHGNHIMIPPGLLELWFSRAHAQPLSLTFRLDPEVFYDKIKVPENVTNALDLDLSAIQSRLVHLDMMHVSSRQPLCSKTPLPLLRRLSARLFQTDIEQVLKTAPLLTELRWDRAFTGHLSNPDFHYFTSTTLTILETRSPYLSAAELITILHNFPSLTDLTCVVDPERIQDSTPLTFSNLLSLRLDHSSMSRGSSIRALELLTLPHLRRLGCSSYLDPDVLLSFLSRSACVIRELEWDIGEGDDLQRLFGLLQSVETLHATVHYRVTRFLRLLDAENSRHENIRLPHLRHMTIEYNAYDTYSSGLDFDGLSNILDVAHQRRSLTAGIARLDSVHLVLGYGTKWEDGWETTMLEPRMRHLALNGLDLTVRAVQSGRMSFLNISTNEDQLLAWTSIMSPCDGGVTARFHNNHYLSSVSVTHAATVPTGMKIQFLGTPRSSRADFAGSAVSLRTGRADIESEMELFKDSSASALPVKQQNESEAHLDAVAHSISSLPTEITCRIFVECLPEDGYVRPSTARAPLLFMRICRAWRDIAVFTPELWCSLELECPRGIHIMIPPGMLETWFSRAPALPLSLTLRRSPEVSREVEVSPNVSRAWELDVSAIRLRLVHLDMMHVSSPWPRRLTSLPVLRRLSATLYEWEIEQVLKIAPSLTELHWHRATFLDHISNPNFQYFTSNTLKILDIPSLCLSGTEFISLLRSFPSLSDLTCVVNKQDIQEPTPATFPNLLSLRLREYFMRRSTIHVLELLTLPRLRRLGCCSAMDPDVLLAFLSRSTCVICELEWAIGEVDDLQTLLGMLQSVETLHATVDCNMARFLQLIDAENSGHQPVRLPQLRHLTIDYNAYETSSPGLDFDGLSQILRVAHQRRSPTAGTARLDSVHLVLGDDTKWEDGRETTILEPQMKRLVSSGLVLTVRVRSGGVLWPRPAGSNGGSSTARLNEHQE
ncbi:F-box domain-containing protein [Mycena sanguinolenta]|uniref:F-box domain-containing protein n=1 Tax=Mycena sanguinolenta TaxID=230812 RepID=A0A8H6ZFU3_9AGAR|nr:F-box domain-containing protein [Mycena sanguinolenta]